MVVLGISLAVLDKRELKLSEVTTQMQDRLCKFLPAALEKSLASYRRILSKPEQEYPDMKKQQEACKVALAHIDLLLKLAKHIEVNDVSTMQVDEQKSLQKLIESAQAEISDRSYL